MKIGIITQPLSNNYGGLLQNWALQQVLLANGHDPITLDLLVQRYPLRLRFNVAAKNFIKAILPGNYTKGILAPMKRSQQSDAFIQQHIKTSDRIDRYKKSDILKYGLDCIIVGSDQVWRPRYNIFLKDMFLNFCRTNKIRKLAYAASLGVDNWELTTMQTRQVRRLIQKFEVVSVREKTATGLLEKYLNCKADKVLDPTLLLKGDDYSPLISNQLKSRNSYIAVYILDANPNLMALVNDFVNYKGLPVVTFSADDHMDLTVSDWLLTIKDADYVITDSFHGMVFCILFRKEFYVMSNPIRGNSRFTSLLESVGLTSRMITSQTIDNVLQCSPINWEIVNSKLERLRCDSLHLLFNALR